MLRYWFSRLAAASVACALSACGGGGQAPEGCPAAGATRASEACVRAELGIPPQAERVLILSQSSHLDWDWLQTFDDYYTQSVGAIVTKAVSLSAQSHLAPSHYYYSIAEIGYLQRFAEEDPQRLDGLRALGADLRIVGGGITSPDNLLPHGESFIRNYLVGKTWVDAALGLPLRAAWIPDDFGHDAQLPITLAAMGFDAVGFARVSAGARSPRVPADEYAVDGRGHHRSEPAPPVGSRGRRQADHRVGGAARALPSRRARSRWERR